MNFTDGDDLFFEKLMKQVPNFDKSPIDQTEMGPGCKTCKDYLPGRKRCRFHECPYKKEHR